MSLIYIGEVFVEPEVAFGKVLRMLRAQAGLTQEQLAFEAEVQRNYISLLERGQNSISLKTLFKIAAALNTTPSEMLSSVEEHTINT